MELPDKAQAVIDDPNFAYLATLNDDGSPHVSTMWIEREGNGRVSVNTAERRVKWHNMRRDPRVSIAIHDLDTPYENITLLGRVLELTTDGADDQIDRLAGKYLGLDEYPYRSPTETRVRVVIDVESVAM